MVLGSWVFRRTLGLVHGSPPILGARAWAINNWTSWMILEAAGLSWRRDMNSGATGERQGLRRPWLLLGPPPHLPPGFSWALAGPIRQYSGACLQPIPPRGPLSCSLRETQQPVGCLVALLLCKGWENFLWPLSLPQGPTLLPWPSGGPCGAGFPPTLGFWRFQSRVFGGVSPFSYVQDLYHEQAALFCVVTVSSPSPSSLENTAVAGDTALKWTPPAFLEPSLHLYMGDRGQRGAPSPQRSY